MARGDQLARQWRIIQTLIASKRGKSVADLVKDENCHLRTVYRDLEALQEAGFPIYQERRLHQGEDLAPHPEDRARQGRLDPLFCRGRRDGRGEALGARVGQACGDPGTGVPPARGRPGTE